MNKIAIDKNLNATFDENSERLLHLINYITYYSPNISYTHLSSLLFIIESKFKDRYGKRMFNHIQYARTSEIDSNNYEFYILNLFYKPIPEEWKGYLDITPSSYVESIEIKFIKPYDGCKQELFTRDEIICFKDVLKFFTCERDQKVYVDNNLLNTYFKLKHFEYDQETILDKFYMVDLQPTPAKKLSKDKAGIPDTVEPSKKPSEGGVKENEVIVNE